MVIVKKSAKRINTFHINFLHELQYIRIKMFKVAENTYKVSMLATDI